MSPLSTVRSFSGSSSGKFGRRYRLQADGSDGKTFLEFGFPFSDVLGTSALTLDFDVNRHSLSEANDATFTLYNLSYESRRNLYYDPTERKTLQQIAMYAGYASDNSPPSMIFHGNITEAYSYRSSPDWVTVITAHDDLWDMMHGHANLPIAASTIDMKTLIPLLLTSGIKMPNTTPSQNMTSLMLSNSGVRGTIIFEPTWGFISEVARNHSYFTYIDIGTLYFNSVTDFFGLGAVSPKYITPETGLLGTPRKRNRTMDVNLILSPDIKIGDNCVVLSATPEAEYSGQRWVVNGIHHHGRISYSSCQDAVTSLHMVQPPKPVR